VLTGLWPCQGRPSLVPAAQAKLLAALPRQSRRCKI
jgi:hypothetical protein